jgi:predicted transcriptional regulator YdeE
MAEITRVYKQSVGAMRFIGKRYGEGDRANGSFAAKWDEWFANGWFEKLESLSRPGFKDTFEESGAYIGLMRDTDGGFEYWIGMFAPEDAAVPEGFEHVEFPKGELGVCWIYGKEAEVFTLEGRCGERLEKEGFNVNTEWCFERYACPRFTTPDEKGNIILDVCFYLR